MFKADIISIRKFIISRFSTPFKVLFLYPKTYF
nr:MAG TPA: hypothetical protein [Caudoviricetes sp.]